MTVQYSPADAAPAVLAFRFDGIGQQRWFATSDALDRDIERRFGALRDDVLASGANAWRDSPDHLLAAIILIDQFSRNIHRGSARAFAGDRLARDLSYLGLDRGWERAMQSNKRQFLLMPLMHSENLADQQRSLDEFAKFASDNLRYAKLHHSQIARFGRFPGRNAALGRRTTPAEQEALDDALLFDRAPGQSVQRAVSN